MSDHSQGWYGCNVHRPRAEHRPAPARSAEDAKKKAEGIVRDYYGYDNECVCNGCTRTSQLIARIAAALEEGK